MTDTGPGGETPSAPRFSVPEFSLRYHIDWRDALAWERLPSELRGLQKAIYVGFLLAGGMAYGLVAEDMPDWVQSIPYILILVVVFGVMQGLWMVYYAALQRYRAQKRLPRRVYCVFEDWGDYVYMHNEMEEVALYADLFRQSVVTPTHLFLDFSGTLIIIPVAAFASPDQCNDFAAKWQRLADEASD